MCEPIFNLPSINKGYGIAEDHHKKMFGTRASEMRTVMGDHTRYKSALLTKEKIPLDLRLTQFD